MHNYSLQALADKVDLTKKIISRYEYGQHAIDMQTLEELAKALEIDIGILTMGYK